MTTQLTEAQRSEISDAVRVGCTLRDALIVAGLPYDQLETAICDPGVLIIAEAARAQGKAIVRKGLEYAGSRGNVSALKLLAKIDEQSVPDDVPPEDKMDEAAWRALERRIKKSCDDAFAYQRKLLEGSEI
jgi:hypothetical protein